VTDRLAEGGNPQACSAMPVATQNQEGLLTARVATTAGPPPRSRRDPAPRTAPQCRLR